MPTSDQIGQFSRLWKRFSADLRRESQNRIFRQYATLTTEWLMNSTNEQRRRKLFILFYQPTLTDRLIATIESALREEA